LIVKVIIQEEFNR